jgi:hypothetical protein
MNPDDVNPTYDPTECHTIAISPGLTVGGISPIVYSGGNGASNGSFNTFVEDPLDKYAMNRFAVDHKVTAAELLKLQEVAPDFAKEIKENIAKNLGRDIATKVSYTKKHDKDTDVHHFIGRVWVFSEEELKSILGIK